MTTVGYGDLLPINWLEHATDIVFMLFGGIIFGFVVRTQSHRPSCQASMLCHSAMRVPIRPLLGLSRSCR